MPSFLQIEHISKSYGPKVLFNDVAFNINEGDKIAIVAPNGTGKTSLMRILAGKEKSDSGGRILFLKDIRIAFLEQEYDYDPDKGIMDQVLSHTAGFVENLHEEEMTEYRQKLREHLTSFGLRNLSKPMKELSGGEVKRVALSEMLASKADFFIMDEPTNHLDVDAIEYLEGVLSKSRCTLLMVTHDRYFLDRVCNTVMEMDHGAIYIYRGNYQNFLEKREERIANYNAETDKVKNILRRELEWIHATPCARSGKAQYRINAFHELKERAEQTYRTEQLSLEGVTSGTRLGTKILNCRNLSLHWGDKCCLKDFTYNFQRYERVGIVGRNGIGKTSFIDLLAGCSTGNVQGVLERGESLQIGYYRQCGIEFNPEDKVLDIVSDTHLLNEFLFTHDMLSTRVGRLSGGERRRLYLMTILMRKPNLLILDEPTNDLDIVTINVLEEYLKEYKGSLIVASHDRHFLDRTVDHLLVFCGEGMVKDFSGKFSEYRSFIKDLEAKRKIAEVPLKEMKENAQAAKVPRKPKLTWKEQRELEALETEISALGKEKISLENKMNSGTLDYTELQKAAERIADITALSEEKEMRWLELSENI